MTTWFDKLKGEASGRITPSIITPTEGTKVFVLGAEGVDELVPVQDGDYTEVHQTVDLTGVDMAGATLETLGVLMTQAKYDVAVPPDPFSFVALWLMDENYEGAANSIQPGINLEAQGDLEVGTEGYSVLGANCKVIPNSSTTAFLQGVNSPALFAIPLTDYSFSLWMNFDADSHVTSDGVNPVIFKVIEPGVGGFEIGLVGETGVGTPHKWWFYMRHVNGANDQTRIFTGYEITTNAGWKMCSIVYNDAETGVNKGKLYIDGAFVANLALTPDYVPAVPSTSTAVTVADPDLVGGISQMIFRDEPSFASWVYFVYAMNVGPQRTEDTHWKMSVLIDDIVYCERRIVASETRRWTDFYAPVRHLSGDHKVAFRLQFEEEV